MRTEQQSQPYPAGRQLKGEGMPAADDRQSRMDRYLVQAAMLLIQIKLGITPVQMGLVRPVNSL